jgi:sulfur-carrier protein
LAQIIFTQQLARFLPVPELPTQADNLRSALDGAFADNARLRGYVLDDQGHLRENVVIFIDGKRSRDRVALDDPLRPDSRVYILQALSGG